MAFCFAFLLVLFLSLFLSLSVCVLLSRASLPSPRFLAGPLLSLARSLCRCHSVRVPRFARISFLCLARSLPFAASLISLSLSLCSAIRLSVFIYEFNTLYGHPNGST